VETSSEALPALLAVEGRAAAGNPFALVVTGLRLPDIDGTKFVAILKVRYPSLPVIVATAFGMAAATAAIAAHPGTRFLTKPVAARDIADAYVALTGRALADATGATGEAASIAFLSRALEVDPEAFFGALVRVPGVTAWDAVRGRFDAVVRYDDTPGVTAALAALPGITESVFRPVAAPPLDPRLAPFLDRYEATVVPTHPFAPELAAAWAVVDIDPPHLSALFPTVYWLDETAHLACDAFGQTLFVLLRAVDHRRIRTLLNQRIRTLDGVLRIEELMVVDLHD